MDPCTAITASFLSRASWRPDQKQADPPAYANPTAKTEARFGPR